MSTPSAAARLDHWLPRLVLAPSFVLSFLFIYGLIAWNGYLSVSASRLLPNYEFVGLEQYETRWESERWWVALKNLAIFGGLFLFFGIRWQSPPPVAARYPPLRRIIPGRYPFPAVGFPMRYQ